MRIAVIDLGTNTCNLLVAEVFNKGFKILHQSKQLVKLGDNKIRDNEISVEAIQRTLKAFAIHKKMIERFHVDKVKVLATSAVRTAKNKIAFLSEISEKSGWLVKLISGKKEAELIFKGVLLAFDELKEPSVILDIGGGSNEIILAHQKEQIWKESKQTGMARVVNEFKISNPIQQGEVDQLRSYFTRKHQKAIKNGKAKGVTALIGCSGAFDTIADLIDGVNPGEKQRNLQNIALSDFYEIYKMLLKSTREERLQMKGMDYVRTDLIVPAMILIENLITEIGIKKIIQTDFALREGVLSNAIKKWQMK